MSDAKWTEAQRRACNEIAAAVIDGVCPEQPHGPPLLALMAEHSWLWNMAEEAKLLRLLKRARRHLDPAAEPLLVQEIDRALSEEPTP